MEHDLTQLLRRVPSVKGIQMQYGKDKVQVLLLSVDLGYGQNKFTAAANDMKRMLNGGVADWPNVLLQNGFKDTQRMFNLDGYGLTLIGPDGIVRAIDIREEEAKEHLSKIYAAETLKP